MSFDNPPSEVTDNLQKTIKRILIADDQDNNRYYLHALLTGKGYQVIVAENGQEVLKKLKTDKVDAIISDILMPLIDGFHLCRTLKENPELANIPFIFYTASYTEQNDRLFGLSLGAEEYICKPIEPDDFLIIIRNVFERVEQRKTNKGKKLYLDDRSYYLRYVEIFGKKHIHNFK